MEYGLVFRNIVICIALEILRTKSTLLLKAKLAINQIMTYNNMNARRNIHGGQIVRVIPI